MKNTILLPIESMCVAIYRCRSPSRNLALLTIDYKRLQRHPKRPNQLPSFGPLKQSTAFRSQHSNSRKQLFKGRVQSQPASLCNQSQARSRTLKVVSCPGVGQVKLLQLLQSLEQHSLEVSAPPSPSPIPGTFPTGHRLVDALVELPVTKMLVGPWSAWFPVKLLGLAIVAKAWSKWIAPPEGA
jgi:hypothetical protein